jgi:hypothetical protein
MAVPNPAVHISIWLIRTRRSARVENDCAHILVIVESGYDDAPDLERMASGSDGS